MKKFAIVLATVSLMSVAACSKSPEAAAVENNADMMADNMEALADNVAAVSNTTMDATAQDNAEAVAENLNAAADNVREAGEEKADNMN